MFNLLILKLRAIVVAYGKEKSVIFKPLDVFQFSRLPLLSTKYHSVLYLTKFLFPHIYRWTIDRHDATTMKITSWYRTLKRYWCGCDSNCGDRIKPQNVIPFGQWLTSTLCRKGDGVHKETIQLLCTSIKTSVLLHNYTVTYNTLYFMCNRLLLIRQ